MSEPPYAKDKTAVFHRVFSLVVLVGFWGAGFLTFRLYYGGYLIPMMMIWFPEEVSVRSSTKISPRMIRFFGWLVIFGVPLWFLLLKWIFR